MPTLLYSEWFNRRSAELNEQLTKEALELELIDSTEVVHCSLSRIISAPTQLKIDHLKEKFGYKDVTVLPEGLSIATEVKRWGTSENPKQCDVCFHILPDGTPAYQTRYEIVTPFVRGIAVVGRMTCDAAGNPPRYHHIYPNGKAVYDTGRYWFRAAHSFSEDGTAQVTRLTVSGQEEVCFIDRGGKIVKKKV